MPPRNPGYSELVTTQNQEAIMRGLLVVSALVCLQLGAANSYQSELHGLVEECGEGVVAGSNQENRCSFQVDPSQFAEQHTGLLPEKNWAHKDGVSFFEPHPMTVPDSYDLRDFMTAGVPVIKQQNCGDCWAWATHHGLEITRAVHDFKLFDLSIQTVLSCSKQGSCNGGYMSAVDFLKHGLPDEPVFPYAGKDKSCKFSSAEVSSGWEGKVIGTPFVGNSLEHSRFFQNKAALADGAKVQKMMEAMVQWKAPLVVTVAAYSISGDGVYDSCSAVNSDGNHMVAIVGWEMWNGKRVAKVWNSWGQGHGKNGVSRIVWECGRGLNRGLGVEAKIVQYKAPCEAPDASQKSLHEVKAGSSVTVGKAQAVNTRCSWVPTEGLADPNACVTTATPKVSTEYHFTAENDCGKSTSQTLVYLWPANGGLKNPVIRTPYGDVAYGLHEAH